MYPKVIKTIFAFLFVMVFGVYDSVIAQTESDQIKAMKWIKRTVQADIKNIVKPVMFRVFTKKELAIAKSIHVNIVLDTRFERVRAINEGGVKIIEISTGFLSLIGSLVDANVVSVKFNKQEHLDNYNILISNYITTYKDQVGKGKKPHWPAPFHKYVGITDKEYGKFLRSKEYDYIYSLNLRIAIAYVLGHEYAHHIFGHLSIKKPENILESRQNEDEADDFTIRVNWMAGNNPLMATNYFLLFTLVENGLHKGTHAPSACRLEKFLDFGIKFTEAEAKNFGKPTNNTLKAQLKRIKGAQKNLAKVCKEGGSLTATTNPGLWD